MTVGLRMPFLWPGITSHHLTLCRLGFLLIIECTWVGVYGGVWIALLEGTQDAHSFTMGIERWHHPEVDSYLNLKNGNVTLKQVKPQETEGLRPWHFHFRLFWSVVLCDVVSDVSLCFGKLHYITLKKTKTKLYGKQKKYAVNHCYWWCIVLLYSLLFYSNLNLICVCVCVCERERARERAREREREIETERDWERKTEIERERERERETMDHKTMS